MKTNSTRGLSMFMLVLAMGLFIAAGFLCNSAAGCAASAVVTLALAYAFAQDDSPHA